MYAPPISCHQPHDVNSQLWRIFLAMYSRGNVLHLKLTHLKWECLSSVHLSTKYIRHAVLIKDQSSNYLHQVAALVKKSRFRWA